MFRSCDSSLWLGSTRNEDEIGWFSASDAIEGSEDRLVSNALRSLSEDLELKNESSSVNDSNMESVCVSYKASSQLSEIDEPVSPSSLTFVNESSQISESKDDFILRDQVSDSCFTNNKHNLQSQPLCSFISLFNSYNHVCMHYNTIYMFIHYRKSNRGIKKGKEKMKVLKMASHCAISMTCKRKAYIFLLRIPLRKITPPLVSNSRSKTLDLVPLIT